MKTSPQRFYRSFVLGFFASLAVVTLVVNNGKVLSNKFKAVFQISSNETANLPSDFRNAEEFLVAATAAKKKQAFWIQNPRFSINGRQYSLQNDELLFESVFPGYAEARLDQTLWDRYFNTVFNQRVLSHSVDARWPGAVVMSSGEGALEIFKRYGANTLVIGTSETFHSVVPKTLSNLIGKNENQSRVLMLARNSMLLETIDQTLDRLLEAGKKVEWIVWGFSYINAFPRSPEYSKWLEEQKHSSDTNESAKPVHSKRTSLSLQFEMLKWSDLVTPLYSMHPSSLININTKDSWTRSVELNKATPMFQFVGMDGAAVSQGVYSDPRALEEFISRQPTLKNPYSPFSEIRESDCLIDSTLSKLDSVLSKMKRIAKRILIFIPPLNAIGLAPLPNCFVTEVTHLVESKRTKEVIPLTLNWKQYGLHYQDYGISSPVKETVFIDANHLNLIGAEKVTRRLAAEMLQAVSRRGSP